MPVWEKDSDRNAGWLPDDVDDADAVVIAPAEVTLGFL